MKSVIIGTAGHIDHGKTALVKALTGIDADRLEEEKRRGITIGIGFAHLELPGPDGEMLRLGFVDVPGHERFVRNMLAGVGGIDLVLLVIAADEGIKPQTREHFDICRLLGIQRGITVLTKSDSVDKDTLEVVRLEVEDFLRASFLDSSRSPIVAVSALTGAGIEDLKRAIAAVAADVAAKDSTAIARLPIDRVFTMKGFGTVVTGTLISGTIRKEEELEVFPSGLRVRVRGLQVHGASAGQAVAGQRTAVNLAGVAVEELSRGMTLAPPETFRSTQRVDVSLSLLPSAKPLKSRARVHFHAYTMETIAEVRLYDLKALPSGASCHAQLKLAAKALLFPGDRFIVRQFSPVVTIGGGVVLDALLPARRQKAENILTILDGGTPESILRSRIVRRRIAGLAWTELLAETGWPQPAIAAHLAEALRTGAVVQVGERLVDGSAIHDLHERLPREIARLHDQNPLVEGIGKEQLREHTDAPPDMFAYVLAVLLHEKKIEITGELARLPGRGVVMKDVETESKKIIEAAFASAGLKVPFLKDVLTGLKVDRARAQKIVTLMLRDKLLVKVSEDLVFHQSALTDLKKRISALKASTPKIDVARFKDLTGVSRKYAIPLLEFLDRERVTRRVGDLREIL
jgi:selenocysteine-specific elongation factor